MNEGSLGVLKKLETSSQEVATALEVFGELQNYDAFVPIFTNDVQDEFARRLAKDNLFLTSSINRVAAAQDILQNVLKHKFPDHQELMDDICDTFGLLMLDKLPE
jgi:hypothetical protein